MLRRSVFSFFVSSDFSLDSLPVYLDVPCKLLELFIGFLPLVHLQESLSVGNHSVNVRLVVYCNF